MLLDECHELWGASRIIEADPLTITASDIFYLPYAHGQAWGLFEQDGRIIEAAVDFRDVSKETHGQLLLSPLRIDQIDDHAPPRRYVYGGHVNLHFGHFIINTLPRFWDMSRNMTADTKILCHGIGSPELWFSIPFIARAFALLGLSVRDFVSFDRPTRLDAVIVPGTSLEEQQAGYQAYGRLGRAIGARVLASSSVEQSDRPVYYSKANLKSAVGVIVNEREIEDVLASKGVDIVHPESLTLDDQIGLMASRTSIMGSSGSFLHTSIFCQNRNITCLNVTHNINSNFKIIDDLAGNSSNYYFPRSIEVMDKADGFITVRHLPDARQVAVELLDLMHAKARREKRRRRWWPFGRKA
ncbi:glycosyltransferase family 61 protein [Methylobacterium sp. ID0610]|uniref:glycosyltransferase family 61 protein n=1 Tax=Methylobacterium carpenticola TaxID=3344827 RepID=UPI003683ED4F